MYDLISRQELLESIERISVKGNVLDDDWIYRFIKEFPSAQPEIIRCKDCKYAHLGSWYCEAWNNSPGFPVVQEDGFCWLAERKEK